MDDQLYREYILEHSKNPQNFGLLDDADLDLADNNPLCGDEIRIMAKVADGRLVQINFIGRGCAISQASASILTEWVKGKVIDDIRMLDQQSFLDKLGLALSPTRLKCAFLPYATLQKALTESSVSRHIKAST